VSLPSPSPGSQIVASDNHSTGDRALTRVAAVLADFATDDRRYDGSEHRDAENFGAANMLEPSRYDFEDD
jgi:hypothetical protein